MMKGNSEMLKIEIKLMNREGRCGTYLRKNWRLPRSVDRLEIKEKQDVSVNIAVLSAVDLHVIKYYGL